ncbi:MAG TPA: ABC transporter ATP-binding protein, partial [Tistrella mobilis]|nr:ABC transporter ATP-binding protein [Tistrella mobilis]
MATVELKNVHKDFGKHRVISDVTLDLQKGEFVVFVGPSGCG